METLFSCAFTKKSFTKKEIDKKLSSASLIN